MCKMSVVEMLIIKWIIGNIIMDKIRRDCTPQIIHVAHIADKMKQNHLLWSCHIQSIRTNNPIQKT